MPRGEGDWTAKPPRAKGERGRAGRTDTNDHNQTACEGRSFSLTILPPLAAFDRGAIPPAAAGEPPKQRGGTHKQSQGARGDAPRGGSGERQGRGSARPWTGHATSSGGGHDQQLERRPEQRKGASGGACRVPGATRGRRGALARGRSADGATERQATWMADGGWVCPATGGAVPKTEAPLFPLFRKQGGGVVQLFVTSPLLRIVLELFVKADFYESNTVVERGAPRPHNYAGGTLRAQPLAEGIARKRHRKPSEAFLLPSPLYSLRPSPINRSEMAENEQNVQEKNSKMIGFEHFTLACLAGFPFPLKAFGALWIALASK